VDGTLLGGVANPISGLANLGIEQLEYVALDGTVSTLSSVTMSEADALYALSQGLTNADFFDGAGGVSIVLQVEGTLLGTAANPLTFAQLQSLGVDSVLADGDAPYLRLISENITDLDTSIDFTDNGTSHVVVDGTTYFEHPTEFSTLGVESVTGYNLHVSLYADVNDGDDGFNSSNLLT
jgi:hypothetical protein